MKSIKKSSLFSISLVMTTLIVLTYALYVLSVKQNTIGSYIGTRQYQAINTYNQGEKVLYYVDESARMAMIDSVYDLAQDGGSPPCGDYNGFKLWNTFSKDIDECYPNLGEGYTGFMQDNMDNYLKTINDQRIYDIPLSNYYFDFSDGLQLYGYPTKKIIIGGTHTRFGRTPSQRQVTAFDEYEIEFNSDLTMHKSFNPFTLNFRDPNFDFTAKNTYFTDGTKMIYANPIWSENKGAVGHPSFISGFDVVNIEKITDENGGFGFPKGFDKVKSMTLTTYKNDVEVCKITLTSDKDMPTWHYGLDSNSDNKIDKSCEDSPAWVECEGIRVYYCGKLGYSSFDTRNIQDWSAIGANEVKDNKNAERIIEHYVNVNTVEDDLNIVKSRINSKVSAKFVANFNPEIKEKRVAALPTKLVSSQGNVKGEEPSNVQYSVNPAFHEKLDYSLAQRYEKIKGQAIKYQVGVRECENKRGTIGNTFEKCLEDNRPADWQNVLFTYTTYEEEMLDQFSEALKQCKEANRDIMCIWDVESTGISFEMSILLDKTIIKSGTGKSAHERILNFNVYDIPGKDLTFNNIVGTKLIILNDGKNTLRFVKKGEQLGILGNPINPNDIKMAKVMLTNRKYAFTISPDEPQDEKILGKGFVTYNLALNFANIFPPKPIEDLKAQSLPNMKNGILLSWEKLPDKDVASYEIYYFNSPAIKDEEITQMDMDAKPISAQLIIDGKTGYGILDRLVENCRFFIVNDKDGTGKVKCLYGRDSSFDDVYDLALNQLYYIKDKNRFMYLLYDEKIEGQYYVGVVGKDKAGNTINNVDEKIKFADVLAIDRLPPGQVEYSIKVSSNNKLKIDLGMPSVSGNLVEGFGFEYGKEVSYFVAFGNNQLDPYKSDIVEGETTEIRELLLVQDPEGNAKKFTGQNFEIGIDDLPHFGKGKYYFTILAIGMPNDHPDYINYDILPKFPYFAKFFGKVYSFDADSSGGIMSISNIQQVEPYHEVANIMQTKPLCTGVCLSSKPTSKECTPFEEEICEFGDCYHGTCGQVTNIVMGLDFNEAEDYTRGLMTLIPSRVSNREDYAQMIIASGREFNMNPYYIATIIDTESSWDPNAVSLAGAYGLMQLLPDTAQGLGCSDAFKTEPQEAIRCGTKYLDQQRNSVIGKYSYCIELHGIVDCVSAAYNGGLGALGISEDCPSEIKYACEWNDPGHTTPNEGYQETRDYVVKVKNYLGELYAQLGQTIVGDYAWPVDTKLITSCYGQRNIGWTEGVDIAAPMGSAVKSISSGIVMTAYTDISDPAGLYIYVKTQGIDEKIGYLHLSSISVQLGQEVVKGQTILGFSGGSGKGSMEYYPAHLDIRFKRNGQWLDPFDPQNGIFNFRDYSYRTGPPADMDSNCIYNDDQYSYLNSAQRNCVDNYCQYS